MIKVFLGGTTNDSTWRKDLIPMLKDSVAPFDPVVDDWNEEAQKNELEERKESDFVLYVLTPQMAGVYSIAEVVEDSVKQPEKTLFAIIEEGGKFDTKMKTSLDAVSDMVKRNDGKVFDSLEGIANFLNREPAFKKQAAGASKLDVSRALLNMAVMTYSGVNIPGQLGAAVQRMFNILNEGTEKSLNIKTNRVAPNIPKMKTTVAEIIKMEEEEAKREQEEGSKNTPEHAEGEPASRLAAEGVETPESSKHSIPEVREIEASDKTSKDIDPKSLYDDRSKKRKPGEQLPENVHSEMSDLLKRQKNAIDFGGKIMEIDLSDQDKKNLGKLFG